MFTRASLLACFVLLLAGCPSKDSGSDGGARDGGPPGIDAGVPTITIQVQTATGGSFSGVNAAWIAARSGTGLWTTPVGSNGAYRIPVADPSGRYTIALRCPFDDGSPQLQLFEGTTLEWGAVTASGCPSNSDGGVNITLAASNTGAGGSQTCNWFFGGAGNSLDCAGAPTTVKAPPGSYDLFGYVLTNGANISLTKFVLQHDVSVSAAASENLNFISASTPSTISISAANPESDTSFYALNALMLNHPPSWTGLSNGNASPSSLQVLGSNFLGPQDANILSIVGYTTENHTRATYRALRSPADLSLTLPKHLTTNTVSNVAGSGGVQLKLDVAGGDPGSFGWMELEQGAKGVNITLAPSVFAAGTYTLPDLTQAPGYDPTWSFQPGVSTRVTFAAVSGNRTLDLNQQMNLGHSGVTDGAELRTSLGFVNPFYP